VRYTYAKASMKRLVIFAFTLTFLTGAVVTTYAQDSGSGSSDTKKKKKKKKTDITTPPK